METNIAFLVILGQLNILVSKYTDMEASDSKTNHELTEDYRTLTLKYKDLQAKFRHFEIADTTKYDEGILCCSMYVIVPINWVRYVFFACPSILELIYLILKPEILLVWTMHEEEVKDLADQALKADKIITEQLFGWKWKAPDIHALQQVIS